MTNHPPVRPILRPRLTFRQPDGVAQSGPRGDRPIDSSSNTSATLFDPPNDGSPEKIATSELVRAVRDIENKSTGGFAKLMVLFVSLGLFVAAGMAWWNPRMIAMLVVVLLFHEAGHYIAMRMFGYRNVKMFFIPFLGAAVSGRHFNIAGWKKAIVYLAGPVPGIVTALPLMWFGSTQQIGWMFELGGMSLVLNALNLLPVMPLDGGWIMHLTVFSRSPILELLSRLLGVVLMVALAFFAESKFLIFVAIPLVLSLPVTYRVAKLVRYLRGAPLPQPERDEIPDAAIRFLGDEMRTTSLAQTPIPQRAALLVQIYESLIVKPPGVIATLSIWFLYGGAFLTAIIGGSTLFAMRGLLEGRFMGDWLQTKNHHVELPVDDTEFYLGSLPIEDSMLAVARFESAEQVTANWNRLDPIDRDHYTHVRIGNVLLASVPGVADRHDVMLAAADAMRSSDEDERPENEAFDQGQIQEQIADFFKPVDPATTWLAPLVAAPDTNSRKSATVVDVISGMQDSIQLSCRAPSVEIANAVAKKDFEVPGVTDENLYIPTWSPIDPPTPQQLTNRGVLETLINGITVASDPELCELRQKLQKSQFQGLGDQADSVRRAGEIQKEIFALDSRYTAKVLATLNGEPAEVAKRYAEYQVSLHQHSADMHQRSVAIEQARNRQGDEAATAEWANWDRDEDDFPTLDDYFGIDPNYLGFGEPGNQNYHFAAHVSGSVITDRDYRLTIDPDGVAEALEIETRDENDDEDEQESERSDDAKRMVDGTILMLHIHRATDRAAAVSAVVAYLQRQGFRDFVLHYSTPGPP